MVYESGFTTRRSYATRPIVSSYTISCPTVERYSRVYKATYPIYSTYAIPYVGYDGGFAGSRVVTSPVRVVTSPARIVSRVLSSPSPVRVVRTTRVISSPEPASYYSSTYVPSSYVTSSYVYSTPTYVGAPMTRVYSRSVSPVRRARSPVRSTPSYLKRAPPGYGARALTNYLNTEPFETFKDETNRIRHRAQSLMRDLHTPVVRRSRSCTPFPVSGYAYEPASQLAFDAYLARITNPVRHVAKEIYKMSHYAEPASKYVGKSHLASVRICGNKAYDVRRPMYDSDRVRTDINLRSWYLRHPPHSSLKVHEKRAKEDGDEAVRRDRVVHHNDVVEHDAAVQPVDAVQIEA